MSESYRPQLHMQVENLRPLILCVSGLDPSGGAGLQADIETIARSGGHALPIASCLTVQNSIATTECIPVDKQLLLRQADSLLADLSISSCKIGIIANEEIAIAIADIIAKFPEIPVVFDPVIAPSNGNVFTDTKTIEVIKKILLPVVTIVTPNTSELIALTSANKSNFHRAQELCDYGPKYVLLTGADQPTSEVVNTLFTNEGVIEKYTWPRLSHSYHGSGCTLSSALAYNLANNIEITDAVAEAQHFTWKSLQAAEPLGSGQWFPNRVNHKMN